MKYAILLLAACKLPAVVADKVCPVAEAPEASSQPTSAPAAVVEEEPDTVEAKMAAMGNRLRAKRLALAEREAAIEAREKAAEEKEKALAEREAQPKPPEPAKKKDKVEPPPKKAPLTDVVNAMPAKSAAKMLQEMGPDAATALLRDLPTEKASELMTAMPPAQAARIASLMQKK